MLKTIGIIGAMPSELADIRNGLPDSEIQKKAGLSMFAAASQKSTLPSARRH